MATVDLRKLDGDQIVVHFGGQLTRVNAYTFANALIAFADTIKAISKLVDQGDQIEIEIESIGPGSFRFRVFVNRITERLLAPHPAPALRILVIVITTMVPYDVREGDLIPIGLDDDLVAVESRGTRFIMSPEMHEDYKNVKNNPMVRKNIGHIFQALEKDGMIEYFGLAKNLKDKELIIQIPRSNFNELAKLAENSIPDNMRIPKKVSMTLYVIKPWIDAEKKKWSFRKHDGSIFAPIKDKKFLERVRSNEIRFGNGDAIYATVEYIEKGDRESRTIDKATYSVIEVHGFFESGVGWTYFNSAPRGGDTLPHKFKDRSLNLN